MVAGLQTLTHREVKQLEEIELYKSNVTTEDLKQLWVCAEDLKVIRLIAFKNVRGCFQALSTGMLLHLKAVTFYNTDVTAEDLKIFFAYALNLIKIVLEGSTESLTVALMDKSDLHSTTSS